MKSLQEVFQPFTIGDTFNVPPKRLISQSQSQMSKSKTFRAPPKKTKQERQRERESALNSVKQRNHNLHGATNATHFLQHVGAKASLDSARLEAKIQSILLEQETNYHPDSCRVYPTIQDNRFYSEMRDGSETLDPARYPHAIRLLANDKKAPCSIYELISKDTRYAQEQKPKEMKKIFDGKETKETLPRNLAPTTKRYMHNPTWAHDTGVTVGLKRVSTQNDGIIYESINKTAFQDEDHLTERFRKSEKLKRLAFQQARVFHGKDNVFQ